MVVRHVGTRAWHQIPARAINPEELEASLPHGGFYRAVECVLCGLEASLRMTYRTVLPSDEA